MLDTIITSKTRIKLLLKFFLNENQEAYLRGLESEFGEGSNAIRIELNKFEKAGLLSSSRRGNKRFFIANTAHPMFLDLQKLVHKYMGLDTIIEKVVHKMGNISEVYLTGRIAKGLDSPIVELLIVGQEMDKAFLTLLCEKAEGLIGKKISYAIFDPVEFKEYIKGTKSELLLIYN
jgi:predicted transcriptional regulator